MAPEKEDNRKGKEWVRKRKKGKDKRISNFSYQDQDTTGKEKHGSGHQRLSHPRSWLFFFFKASNMILTCSWHHQLSNFCLQNLPYYTVRDTHCLSSFTIHLTKLCHFMMRRNTLLTFPFKVLFDDETWKKKKRLI